MDTAQVYKDHTRLLHKICWDFRTRYGGDWEELRSIANLHFMQAIRSYDDKRASLSTWVRLKVWNALRDNQKKETVRNRREHFNYDIPDRQRFDLDQFKKELSPKARRMINVALAKRERTKKEKRNAVIQYFKDIGWSMKTIMEGFAEIAEALQT
jgi:RNA polymerase sigma factor (sigma-70 family)